MRGNDENQLDVFSYVNPEQRFAQDHPLRSLRAITDEAIQRLNGRLEVRSRPCQSAELLNERVWPPNERPGQSEADFRGRKAYGFAQDKVEIGNSE